MTHHAAMVGMGIFDSYEAAVKSCVHYKDTFEPREKVTEIYNRLYDDQSQLRVHLKTQAKLHIQDMIKTGNLSLIGSYTLDYEVSQNPFEARKKAIRQFVDQNMTAYVGVERDTPVSAIAEEIMRSGVKEKDAYHVAAAIYASCDYFITTDYRLLKYRDSRIRLCSPIDFIIETEGEP